MNHYYHSRDRQHVIAIDFENISHRSQTSFLTSSTLIHYLSRSDRKKLSTYSKKEYFCQSIKRTYQTTYAYSAFVSSMKSSTQDRRSVQKIQLVIQVFNNQNKICVLI